jgi:hypothetical protein
MKHFILWKICALAGCLFFIGLGADMIIHPKEMVMISASHAGSYRMTGRDKPVLISKTGSQFCGALIVTVGIGLTWLVVRSKG